MRLFGSSHCNRHDRLEFSFIPFVSLFCDLGHGSGHDHSNVPFFFLGTVS